MRLLGNKIALELLTYNPLKNKHSRIDTSAAEHSAPIEYGLVVLIGSGVVDSPVGIGSVVGVKSFQGAGRLDIGDTHLRIYEPQQLLFVIEQ